jgi:hypothetical protein
LARLVLNGISVLQEILNLPGISHHGIPMLCLLGIIRLHIYIAFVEGEV